MNKNEYTKKVENSNTYKRNEAIKNRSKLKIKKNNNNDDTHPLLHKIKYNLQKKNAKQKLN